MQHENSMLDEYSIPRERIVHLPDADASDDAAWSTNSDKFSSFVCPICLRVPYAPYQPSKFRRTDNAAVEPDPSIYCRHVFCLACTSPVSNDTDNEGDNDDGSGSFTCSICNLLCDRSSLNHLQFWNVRLCSTWSRITVRCSWNGCDKAISINDQLLHEHNCEHRLVKCSIPQCQTRVRPADLNQHLEECTHAIRRCSCGLAVSKDKKETHDCFQALRKALTDATALLQMQDVQPSR